MRNNIKTILGVASGALLVASMSAHAGIIMSGTSELASQLSPSLPPSITVTWDVNQLSASLYEYDYVVNNPAGNTTTVDFFNVSFNASAANVLATAGGLFSFMVPGVGVDFVLFPVAPGTSSSTLLFISPLPPTLGNANAADHNPPSPWASTTKGGEQLAVPSVPDGGLTLSLLGFALVGVEGLRRKLKM